MVNPNDLVAWKVHLSELGIEFGWNKYYFKIILVTMYQSGFNAAIILGGGAMMATASEKIRGRFLQKKNIS